VVFGRGHRSGVATAVLLLAVLGTSTCRGCSRAPTVVEAPALGSVVVRRMSGATVHGTEVALDAARIASKAGAVLEGSGIFSASTKSPVSAHVSIEIDVLGEGDGTTPEIGVKVRVKIEILPPKSPAGRYRDDLAAVGQVPLAPASPRDLGGVFQRLAERTLEDLLLGYVARKQLWRADESEIAKALASANNDLRIEAIRVAGGRKMRRQLPSVLRLLADEDEATRDAALGAVVAMGERSAIKALAESHQMRDSYEMGKVIDAVASLGGREAQEYLSFVAETHDDADIRSMAKEALERLETRREIGTPTK
jgi:hypothetical protein